MNEQAAREYSESLGQIFDGGYRQAAWADKQKIPQALGLSMRDWVYQYLGGYVRMSVEQRNEAVRELAADGISQAGIVRALGLSDNTVAAIVKGEEPQEHRRRAQESSPAATVQNEESSPAATVQNEEFIDLSALQKAANSVARDDPLAALYGALKALAWLKARWTPDLTADLDPDDRRRIDGDLEEYMGLLRKVQAQMAEPAR